MKLFTNYIIILVLIYIFFYIQFQRYIYKLDSELAYKTKERIITKFDSLDQPDKLNFDKGLINDLLKKAELQLNKNDSSDKDRYVVSYKIETLREISQ